MKTSRPSAPPLLPHRFVPAGAPDHAGHETCARCPLPQTRTDVHHEPTGSDEAREIDARVLGEHDQ